jgi:hypothetical protein
MEVQIKLTMVVLSQNYHSPPHLWNPLFLLLSTKHFPFLSTFLFALSPLDKHIYNGQQQSQKAGPSQLEAILDNNNNDNRQT